MSNDIDRTHDNFEKTPEEKAYTARFVADGLTARLMDSPYGYEHARAQEMAQDLIGKKSPGWLSVFLGETRGCSNCGEPAAGTPSSGAPNRCLRCEVLPSDYV